MFWNLSWVAPTTPLEDNVELSKSQVGQYEPVRSKSQQLKSKQIVSSRQKFAEKNLTRKSNPWISLTSCENLKNWMNVNKDTCSRKHLTGQKCRKFKKKTTLIRNGLGLNQNVANSSICKTNKWKRKLTNIWRDEKHLQKSCPESDLRRILHELRSVKAESEE